MRRALAALIALGLPSRGYACAACVAAADKNNRTFFIMTIVLSLLPLAMIGGGLWWVARQARGRLAADFSERASAAPASDPPLDPGAVAPEPALRSPAVPS